MDSKKRRRYKKITQKVFELLQKQFPFYGSKHITKDQEQEQARWILNNPELKKLLKHWPGQMEKMNQAAKDFLKNA